MPNKQKISYPPQFCINNFAQILNLRTTRFPSGLGPHAAMTLAYAA